jgi:heme exporter protein C
MKGLWWKVLATVLLLYVVIVGLRTPLRPAIAQTSVSRIAPGPVELEVWGYGTHFRSDQLRAWLLNDSQRVCAASVTAFTDDHLRASFDVPQGLRGSMTDLVVFNGRDGAIARFGAFFTDGLGKGITESPCVGGKYLGEGFAFPNRDILNESIRNLFFHVPMWFTMVVLMSIGVWKSILVLRTNNLEDDRAASVAVQVGLVFGVLGLITGSLWARVTWEAWWTPDVKLNGAAAGVLIYLAYLVLRGSVPEPSKRARLAAIYSVFAFTFMLLFFFVLPRLNTVESLHPGNGGNPAFGTYDLDNRLRTVFYPACVGWILFGVWMYDLRNRLLRLQNRFSDANDQ